MHKSVAKHIAGKNILISGAGTGLGREIATLLCAQGARLVLVGRTEQTLQESVELCHKHSQQAEQPKGACHHYVADVSTWEGARQAVEYAETTLDGVDIVVANAGRSMHAPIQECMPTAFEAMMQSNYYSAVNLIQHALPHIIKRSGIVCAVTSIQALIGVPNHAPYVAAKHALSGYLETLELEHPEISVVEIIPGWIHGTALRSSAIDGRGRIIAGRDEHKRHSRSSVSVEECATVSIDAIAHKKRYVYRPKFWKNILFAKFFFPRTLQKVIIKRQKYSAS